MLKRSWLISVTLFLLVLPLAVRWLVFYEGVYRAEEISQPSVEDVDYAIPEVVPFQDDAGDWTPGMIVVDMAHDNRFELTELGLLRARLAARQQQISVLEEASDLQARLRDAKALITISPGASWEETEIDLVERFVEKGGRVLLVTDPTRFQAFVDEWGLLMDLDHDVVHINNLASRFGLIFHPDYLYNTVENAGNFRNIQLTDFGDDPLVQGLDQLVFYAAHSIESVELALVSTSGATRSSVQTDNKGLPVAVLAASGQVLALGDLTFMIEPYQATQDNAKFVARIADFLSGAQRRYELGDFPHFFGDTIDLVYSEQTGLHNHLLRSSGTLQARMSREGKDLVLRDQDSGERDVLLVSLYDQVRGLEPYLSAAGVTMWITPTAETADWNGGGNHGTDVTASRSVPPTEGDREGTESDQIWASIDGLGEVTLDGMLVVLWRHGSERSVLVVMAETELGLDEALLRLSEGNLDTCVMYASQPTDDHMLALCPTDETGSRSSGDWSAIDLELPLESTELPGLEPAEPLTETNELP